MKRLFDPYQIALAGQAFRDAETMAGRYFRMTPEDIQGHRYDVQTRAFLREHEVEDGAFAHLCRYAYEGKRTGTEGTGIHFYRICLQDSRILDAVERAGSFVRLKPLLVYIAVHELVHVIRFDRGFCDFNATPEEKAREEERVHGITRQMVQSLMNREMNLVVDCFHHRYRIGDMLQ